jgi:hypothetical protein
MSVALARAKLQWRSTNVTKLEPDRNNFLSNLNNFLPKMA